MASANDIRAGGGFVEITSKDSMAAGLNSALARVSAFGAAVRGIGASLTAGGGGIFASLSGAGAAFAEHGSAVEQGSRATGLSADAYSTMGYAAKQVRVDTEQLDTAISHMGSTLGKAAEGSKQANAALSQLGLSVGDLSKLSQEDRFKLIADRISKIPDPALRAADAIAIFGRGGAELLPLLTLGSQGIQQMQDHARALGIQWSGPDAAAAGAFSRVLKDMWDVLSNGVDVIGGTVAPVLSQMARNITAVAIAVTQWVREHRDMIATAAVVAAKIAAVSAVVIGLGVALGAIAGIVGTVAALVTATLGAIAAILSPLGLVIAAVAGAAAYFLYFSNIGAQVGNAITDVWKQIYNAIKFVFENTSTAAGAWTAAMTIGGTFVMEAWAEVVNYLQGLWSGFKAWFLDLWNSIATSVLTAVAGIVEGVVDMVAQGAADQIKLAIDLASKGAIVALKIAASVSRIDTSEAQKTIIDAANLGKQVAQAGSDAITNAATDKFDAFKEANLKAEAIEKQRIADELAADKTANAQKLADAIATAKKAREAYEEELKKAHDASGLPSIADQFGKLTGAVGGQAPDLPTPPSADDLYAAVKQAKGSVEGTFSAQAAMRMGGGSTQDRIAKATEETAKNTAGLKEWRDNVANRPGLNDANFGFVT